jgi:amidohydrolase
MDALPIQEESEAAYTSRHAGVMHACGHDGHTAVGLTVASILAGIRERLQGGVKFVFQPAEEGLGGAERMIAEGVLAGPELFAAFAFHLWNEKPIGWFAMPDGPMMAGADMFDIRIRGRGGHGANPHQANDPILAAAQITSAIQSVVSRNIDPLRVAVVSVTQMAAGETFNVIPDQASLQGTIRTFDPAVRQIVLQRMEAISIGIAGGMGCTAELEVDPLTPPLVNDGRCAAAAREIASQLFPSAHIVEQERTTGSEDMAFFLQSIPGCYIFIGSSDAERGLDAPHHSPHFDFDERALTHAAALLSAIAFRTLESA